MDSEEHIKFKEGVEALANSIKLGIEQKGVHMLLEDELTLFWKHKAGISFDEKIFMLKNFASIYGFDMFMNNSSTIAVFRNSNWETVSR